MALLNDPNLIRQAHRNFLEAGAEIIITASYQISRQGFTSLGFAPEDADAALKKSVEIARDAVGGTSAQVAASIGPYGAVLHDGSEYRGNYGLSEDDLYRFHAERIEVLCGTPPDILLAETIPDLTEAKALARALKGVEVPVWISFSSNDGKRLSSGAPVEAALDAVQEITSLRAVGFNCIAPELVTELVTRAHEHCSIDLAVYPNKGGTWNPETGAWGEQGRQDLSQWWEEWRTLPIRYLGGCCGTHAEDIAELRRATS